METLVRPPLAAPQPDRPRRRVIRWIVVSVVVIVVAAVAVACVYLLRYQPLSANGTGSFGVDHRFATSRGDFISPSGESFTAYDVSYSDGERFSYSFTIGNLGRFPVTIDSVAPLGCERCVFPLEYVATALAPPSGPDMFDPVQAEPFTPFRLDREAYRLVVIETRFAHCDAWGPGSSTTSSIVEVSYHTGPVHHTVRLTLPYTLTVAFTASTCPD